MKLKAIYWLLFNKPKYRLYEILCWIENTKNAYLKDVSSGLCLAFFYNLPSYFSKEFYIKLPGNICQRVSRIIPEYTPEYFGTKEIEDGPEEGYWWDRADRQSRIEALDKLIQVYKEKLR